MVTDVFQDLMRHMEWADATVWNSVLADPRARSDERVRDCLHHAHVVQWAYLQIWRDEPVEVPAGASFDDLFALRAWGREYHRQVAVQLETLSGEALDHPIEFPWAEQLAERFGGPAPATLAETILQIVSHTTYHRGQVNMRLRDLGAEPPLADFIAWVWMRKPEAGWKEHPGV
ncbi:MAG: DinB family protein [Gemmatimonadales bacterium]